MEQTIDTTNMNIEKLAKELIVPHKAYSQPSFDSMVAISVRYLFPNQPVSNRFKAESKKYIQSNFEKLNCCVLFTIKNSSINQSFKELMRRFPELDCGLREIIIHENGSISFKPNYHTNRQDKVLSVL